MRIEFVRTERGGSVTRIERLDGVLVAMRGYSVTSRLPHDLAHAVTERELGLPRGVFGSVLAGAVFRSVTVPPGRPRHDAAARSARILRANRADLTASEVLSGAVHHAVEHGGSVDAAARAGWGTISAEPFRWDVADVHRAVDTLRALAPEWDATGAGAALTLSWPRRLVSPVAPPVSPSRRQRSGPQPGRVRPARTAPRSAR